ncbi:hypothetical protein A2U01_0072909, partial [Trifolium medium]|nr:hypothetical protein [Trifolium medium]
SYPSYLPQPPPQQRLPHPESLAHRAPRHPHPHPPQPPHAQGCQVVAHPHHLYPQDEAQPQAQGHPMAQAVAMSEAYGDVSGDPPVLPILAL